MQQNKKKFYRGENHAEVVSLASAMRTSGYATRFDEYKERLSRTNLNINIKLLPIQGNPFTLVHDCDNPILFCMSDGSFAIAPSRLIATENSVKNFLGIKYSRLTHWGLLPTLSSPMNMNKKCSSEGMKDALR